MSENNIKSIDLGRLPVGEPLEVETNSGTIYVLTRLARSERTKDAVSQVLIATMRIQASRVSQLGSFVYNEVPRVLEIGKALTVGLQDGHPSEGGRTGRIRAFRLFDCPQAVANSAVLSRI